MPPSGWQERLAKENFLPFSAQTEEQQGWSQVRVIQPGVNHAFVHLLLLLPPLPRYSHTAHVHGEKLLLVGGVWFHAPAVPGVAVIDLATGATAEYCIDTVSCCTGVDTPPVGSAILTPFHCSRGGQRPRRGFMAELKFRLGRCQFTTRRRRP